VRRWDEFTGALEKGWIWLGRSREMQKGTCTKSCDEYDELALGLRGCWCLCGGNLGLRDMIGHRDFWRFELTHCGKLRDGWK
jgi:hypothetical protein